MSEKTHKTSQAIDLHFCEGESEQQYADFLHQKFNDVAVLKRVNKTGLFDFAADSLPKM